MLSISWIYHDAWWGEYFLFINKHTAVSFGIFPRFSFQLRKLIKRITVFLFTRGNIGTMSRLFHMWNNLPGYQIRLDLDRENISIVQYTETIETYPCFDR